MRKLNYISRLSDAIERRGLKGTAYHICRVGTHRAMALPIRLKRQYDVKTKLPSRLEKVKAELLERRGQLLQEICTNTLTYIESNHIPAINEGAYSYKPGGSPILYASCYAVLARHLYNDITGISESSRHKWIRYIQDFQADDGLFRDPLIDIPLASEFDSWGWRHLTLHTLMALSALGGVAEKPFRIIEPFRRKGFMSNWLESRNWSFSPAHVSNEVQNYATLLQYARDFQKQTWCDEILVEMYDWLDKTQDSQTGLWGNGFNTPELLSNGVQTGYHFWLLYFYDQRPIRHIERIIDSCLATQNMYGGFGVPLNSSACEDIDSIDPLVRFSFLTDYRRQDIKSALEKAFGWILVNANPDGGWVFRRHEAFEYGHEQMRAEVEESAMFPTWFRTLTLAYLGKVLVDTPSGSYPWTFLNGPGLQFWKYQMAAHDR